MRTLFIHSITFLSVALALGACASTRSGDPFADKRVVELEPTEGADARVRLEIVPVPGLDGPTGDEIWVLHRIGRYTRWRGCQDGELRTDNINLSLGRPEIDTAWEPHLVVHELASWLVSEPLVRRAVHARRGAIRACGMVWRLRF